MSTKRRKHNQNWKKHHDNDEDDAARHSCRPTAESSFGGSLPAQIWLPVAVLMAFAIVYLYMQLCHIKQLHQHSTFDRENHNKQYPSTKTHPMSHFDWIPGKPAGIYDPVDDSNYPYNILKTIKPRKMILGDREIVPMELKPTKHGPKSSVRYNNFVICMNSILGHSYCYTHTQKDHVTQRKARCNIVLLAEIYCNKMYY